MILVNPRGSYMSCCCDEVSHFAQNILASLVYGFNWTRYLSGPGRCSGANVVDSVWTVLNGSPPITIVDQGWDSFESWVKVTGGEDQVEYKLQNLVTFSNGTTDVRFLFVRVNA
jgi:hypothetical protein